MFLEQYWAAHGRTPSSADPATADAARPVCPERPGPLARPHGAARAAVDEQIWTYMATAVYSTGLILPRTRYNPGAIDASGH